VAKKTCTTLLLEKSLFSPIFSSKVFVQEEAITVSSKAEKSFE
jgi:hypothetical protein